MINEAREADRTVLSRVAVDAERLRKELQTIVHLLGPHAKDPEPRKPQ